MPGQAFGNALAQRTHHACYFACGELFGAQFKQ
jgi:hypothetical protein